MSVDIATQTDAARPMNDSSTNKDWCNIVCVDASTQTSSTPRKYKYWPVV